MARVSVKRFKPGGMGGTRVLSIVIQMLSVSHHQADYSSQFPKARDNNDEGRGLISYFFLILVSLYPNYVV